MRFMSISTYVNQKLRMYVTSCGFISLLIYSLLSSEVNAAERLWPDNLFAVQFVSKDRGFVAGETGTILRTDDAGNSWKLFYIGSPELIRRISFISADEGWAIGHKGSIFHTKDAGEHWVLQHTENGNYLRDVTFVDSQQGWVVGHAGLILHTSDGGKTWTKQYLKGYFGRDVPRLHGIHSLDSSGKKLIAVGEFGVIAHTENGGELWVVTPVDNDITWLAVTATSECITVVGLDGNAACLKEANAEERAALDELVAQQVAALVEKARKKAERRHKQYIPGEESEIYRGELEYVVHPISTGTTEHLFDVDVVGKSAVAVGRSSILNLKSTGGEALTGLKLPLDYLWFGGVGASGPDTFWSVGIRGTAVKGNVNKGEFQLGLSLSSSTEIEVVNSRWMAKQ